jgi:hypothetical protein
MLPEEEAIGLVELLAVQEAGNPHAHLLHARVLPYAILRSLGLLQMSFYLDTTQGTSSRILNGFAVAFSHTRSSRQNVNDIYWHLSPVSRIRQYLFRMRMRGLQIIQDPTIKLGQ